MKRIPYIPASAPFSQEQRAWLNGYFAGLFADAELGENGVTAVAPSSGTNGGIPQPLLILFGSQTGTAEGLARKLATDAQQRGFQPRVLEMNAFASVNFAQEQRLLIVTSTWGDGDPPDNAVAFWNHLSTETAPKLDHVQFSVLALGDRNYASFCGAGIKFDERLAQLGAKRIHPRVDCDTDYETPARSWMEGLWPALSATSASEPPKDAPGVNGVIPSSVATSPPAQVDREPAPSTYSRKNPFPARLLTNRKLNATGSAKETRHLEISLAGSGLSYEAGDALGVMPSNCPALVNEILQALRFDGEEAVPIPGGDELPLRTALLRAYQVTQIPPALIEAYAKRSGDATLQRLLDPAQKADLDKFLYGRDLLDLAQAFPSAALTAVELAGCLRKLQPRLYSISSSPKAHPGEVHLTVGVVRYTSQGRERKGVCSTFFADRVAAETPVPVFIQTAHGFRLPTDGDTPVIMIGPGTGIAPFRAFLEERRATGAKGRNWVFFGDQCAATDFLYREELEAMQSEGTLARLSTAFSRDQTEKIYVQHRMLEHAQEVWSWLEGGAHLYVCGDAKRMAKDVDAALHEVIQRMGGRTAEQAIAYVANLKAGKRYQRDVY